MNEHNIEKSEGTVREGSTAIFFVYCWLYD